MQFWRCFLKKKKKEKRKGNGLLKVIFLKKERKNVRNLP